MTHDDNSEGLVGSLERGASIIRATAKTLSSHPGVYRLINAKGEIIYVGKARRLKHRVVSYAQVSRLPHRLQRMVAEVDQITVVETHTETEALLLESNFIKRWRPRYNILLKDDKSFPYIFITKDHAFPGLGKHRGPKDPQTLYFGPFASSSSVDETLTILYKIFRLRSCSDSFFANRERPCLQYYIKRCTAPCVDKVSLSDYAKQVNQVIAFFRGETIALQQQLALAMQDASAAQAYEEAAILRDRLRLLRKVQARQRIHIQGFKDADVLGLVQEAGLSCVQVFFFRNGTNYGTESFFLAHHQDSSPPENLAAFIMQFYQEHLPPSLILLSHDIPEKALTIDALKKQHQLSSLTIQTPQQGTKKELITQTLDNAKAAIRRQLMEQNNFDQAIALVQSAFALPCTPERIEVYDNSHLQGSNPYGVMIVATPQGFDRKSYRKFSLANVSAGRPVLELDTRDDCAMMREVLRRRFARAGEEAWPLPNLILIDGGKGQIASVAQAIKELDIEGVSVIGIAKGPNRNAGQERFYLPKQEGQGPDQDAITFPPNSPVLHFLQRLRDEAHRFAIGTHRKARQKQLVKSLLDDIPGVGPQRKKALLLHFGSAKAASSAATADLEKVPGINKSIAKKIYAYFHDR
ncbi:MAG: excinuclease ABC subunit UvrC [Alphaproteobacteria bacterium]